jgi:L-ribulose-5-phosphate 3-epimerase
MKNLGFMQGRLVPQEKDKIQSFPWVNWKDEFKISNKIGLNLMEWTLDYKKFYKNPINDKEGRKLINYLKKKNNIKIKSITCDFFMQFPYFLKKNKRTLKMLNDLIVNAKELNIKYLVLPLVDNGSLKTKRIEKKFIDMTLKLQKKLLNNKVKIIFESDFHPQKLLKFISKFPKESFGINYDSGNSAGQKFFFEEEKIYFDRVLNIHLKDKNIKNVSVNLGEGVANFKDLFNYCKKIKYKGNFIFQTARNKNDIGIMKKNILFFKKLYE